MRSARAAWPDEDAAIQSLYCELGSPWVAIQKKIVSWLRGSTLGRDTAHKGCDMAQQWATIRRNNAPRYDAGGFNTCGSAHDTTRRVRAAGSRVVIQILYRDRKGLVTQPCVAT